MKKIVSILLCGMLMVGCLSAFAGSNSGIDCDHSSSISYRQESDSRGTCLVVRYNAWYCDDCGAHVKNTNVQYIYSHSWSEDLIDGQTVCTKCGETK